MLQVSIMQAHGKALSKSLRRLHENETGAEEGMNKLLIFAMVALPLLALLLFFGDAILEIATNTWESVFGGGTVEITPR